MLDKPIISDVRAVAKSRIFTIEAVDLSFSNGEQRTYERCRMQGFNKGAVLVVPVTAEQELILVKEYAVGFDEYKLTFPKGMIDEGETPEQAANREMQEEAGYKAKTIIYLKTVGISPSYIQNSIQIFLAQDLAPSVLSGDEPELLEVIKWPLAKCAELLSEESFFGALSLAALLLAKEKLRA